MSGVNTSMEDENMKLKPKTLHLHGSTLLGRLAVHEQAC